MRKLTLFLCWGLLSLGCSPIDLAPNHGVKDVEICFTASFENIATKTERQENDGTGNYPVYWCPGDAVSLFFNQGDQGGSRFVAQNTTKVEKATFKGTITGFAGGGEQTGGEFWFWGVYPYSEDNSCDGSSVTITLPEKQTAKAGSFSDGLWPTMARSKGLELSFYNICGGVKFSVSRNDITAVKFRGNSNESLAGTARIEWDKSGHPVVKEHLSGKPEITVSAPGGGTFEPGESYYIVFYPELLSKGFTLTYVTSGAKQGVLSSSASRQFNRGLFVPAIDLDSHVNTWTDVENPSGQEQSMAGGGTKSGLYLGIIGFNDELYKMDIERLDADSKTRFDAFIDGLTKKNGTLLYYSVDQSLRTLKQAQYPDDLYDVSLVTFTDGLDMGSAMMMDNYTTDDECLESLHNQLSVSSIYVIPLAHYSIGLMGNDVKTTQQKEMFRKNLKKLAYPENNAYEENNMASVNARFQEIADKISQTTSTTKYNLELTIPGKASGTVWRFTLDGATSSESSTMYIEGTFNLSTKALNNVTYHGMTCSSGSTVQGVVNGIHITYTFSDIVPDGEKTLSKDKVWTWFYVQSSSGFWQGNTEFSQDEDVNIKVIRTNHSVVVLLNLDCSTSLGNDFSVLQDYAKSFIAKLCEATIDKNAVASVSLNSTYLNLVENQTKMLIATVLPGTAIDKSVTWYSDNASVATVSSEGMVTAISPGVTTIYARTIDGGFIASCKINVRAAEVVDLGLSVKWATFNVGASSPEEYGDYFAWGETTPKDSYTWSNYKWCNGSYKKLTKYNEKSDYGVVDNIYRLEMVDDAARANWGGKWRMPTDTEWFELMDTYSDTENYTWTWCDGSTERYNGTSVKGWKLVRKATNATLFLPAASCIGNTYQTLDTESCGLYWCSTRSSTSGSYPHYAIGYGFNYKSIGENLYIGIRSWGCSVRPVTE